MSKTIEAMKHAITAINRQPYTMDKDVCEAMDRMREAIAAEEAQGVEPSGKPTVMNLMNLARSFRAAHSMDYDHTYKALQDACYAVVNSKPPATKQPMPAEREALIDELRFGTSTDEDDVLMMKAADMLEADAQQSAQLTEAVDANARLLVRIEGMKRAQQVAVPQGYGELIRVAAWLLSPEPTQAIDALEENTHIGHRQFSVAQESLHDMLRRKAIAIKDAADKLAAAPHPPQADAQAPTGWDTGLSQDYCKGLGQWLANRPGARQQLREMLAADHVEDVRYCYECGSIGEVPEGKRDCCPDGSHAKRVNRVIAEQAHRGFRAMVPMTDAQIVEALGDEMDSDDAAFIKLARAVEAHHGIK